jgi:methionine synthase II (cobalamin-independent)
MTVRPFHADIVGSFLRTSALKKAREDFKNGEIEKTKLTEIEHAEVKHLVDLEVKHGLKAVTDGEFTRGLWHVDFFLGLKGYTPFRIPGGLKFSHTITRDDGYFPTGKIEFNPNHPFFDYFKYLKSVTPEGTVSKFCIPSPPMGFVFGPDIKPPNYNTLEEFLNDLGTAYNKTIRHFYDIGCRYIQLDDCFWNNPIGLGVTAKTPEEFAAIDTISGNAVTVINLAIKLESIFFINLYFRDLPADLLKTLHICRGNYQSDYFATGAYDPIAVHLAKVCAVLFGYCMLLFCIYM